MCIKTIRIKLGISQDQLARAVGVSQGAVSSWEQGRSYPTISTAIKLAQALHCTVDELLQETIKETTSP